MFWRALFSLFCTKCFEWFHFTKLPQKTMNDTKEEEVTINLQGVRRKMFLSAK